MSRDLVDTMLRVKAKIELLQLTLTLGDVDWENFEGGPMTGLYYIFDDILFEIEDAEFEHEKGLKENKARGRARGEVAA